MLGRGPSRVPVTPAAGRRRARPGRPPVGRHRSGDPGRGLGGEQVEGRRAVRELLVAGRRRVRDVWLAQGPDTSPLLAEIVDRAGEQRVPVRTVTRDRLAAAARTSAPQGVLAHADPLPEADLDDLAHGAHGAHGAQGAHGSGRSSHPLVVALDGVTDPHNLGAVLRTAECAGATGAVMGRHGAVTVTPTVAKVAAGAIEHLRLATVSSVPAALAGLKRSGLWAVGLDADAPQSLFDLGLGPEPLVLVLGSEGRGLSRLTRERCDAVVSIPRLGVLPSLNVAAAAAVACFEIARRRMEA